MMSGKTWLTVGLVASLVLNVAVVGAFFARRLTHKAPPPFHAMRHVRPPEREAMRELKREFRKRMDSLHDEMKTARHALVELLPEENPDPAEVDRRLETIADLQEKMNRKAFEVTREMAKSLPPEQAQKMYRMFEKQYRPHRRRPRRPRRSGERGREPRFDDGKEHGYPPPPPPPPEGEDTPEGGE
jgi:uncharacterized membrane protein